jgi:galactokinase
MKLCLFIGAGWGGFTVSLVTESKVEAFIQTVKAGYPPYKDLEGEKLSEAIFATKPGSGACGQYSRCNRVRSMLIAPF